MTDKALESKQSFEDARRIERLVYCILCGLCWTCPVSGKKSMYLGPASLAKAYRFIDDSRISKEHQKEIYNRIMKEDGVPLCQSFFTCNIVCPQKVMPGTAIEEIRRLDKK